MLFGREIYTPEIVLKSLKLAGYELDESNLRKIAQDIYAEKYHFKIKSGFNFDSLNLPKEYLNFL